MGRPQPRQYGFILTPRPFQTVANMTVRFQEQNTTFVTCTLDPVWRCTPPALVIQPTYVQHEDSVISRYSAGSDTPHFYQRLRNGDLLPLNPYVRWDYEYSSPKGTRVVSCCGPKNYTVNCDFRNEPQKQLVPPQALQSFLDRAGVIKYDNLILSAMADSVPSLDLLTELVELRKTEETLRTIHSTMSGLFKKARRYTRGTAYRHGHYQTLGALAEAWLWARYAILTTLYSMQDVVEFVNYPIRGYTTKGSAGESYTDDEASDEQFVTGHCITGVTESLQYDLNIRALVAASFDVRALNVLVDIPTTLWEVLPYSWVADWFFHVGDALKAWKVRRTSRAILAAIGTKLDASRISTRYQLPYICSCSSQAVATESLRLVQRAPVGIPGPVPSPTWTLSPVHLGDLVSLCYSLGGNLQRLIR